MKSSFILIILSILISLITSNDNKSNTNEQTEDKNSRNNAYNEESGYSEEYLSKQKEMEGFNYEWMQKMSDYQSPYVYMIPVAYKARQIFYENITQVPATIRGAYILDETKKEKIDFLIKSPSGSTVYSNTTHSAIFIFNVTEAGIYEIIFSNRYKNAELKPAFTMNTQQNKILQKEDLNQTEASIDQMIAFLKGISTEDKMKRNIHRERYLSKSS